MKRTYSILRTSTPLFFLTLVLFGGMLTFSHAQEDTLAATAESYQLTLLYDGLRRSLTYDQTLAYRIIAVPFVPSVSQGLAEYLGVLRDAKENILAEAGFDRPARIIAGKVAPLRPTFPYFPNAVRIDVYQGSELLFAVDVSGSAICREDGICNGDVGEQYLNCPSDCSNVRPVVAPLPPPPRPKSTEPSFAPSGRPSVLSGTSTAVLPEGMTPRTILAIAFFLLALVTFAVWFYVRRKQEEESSTV